MDKFGSLFASPFTPGDGEGQTADLEPGFNYDINNMRLDIPNYGREGMPDSFNLPPQGPVVPPQFDMPSPAVLPPGFDDNMPQPGVMPDLGRMGREWNRTEQIQKMPGDFESQIRGGGMFGDIFKSLPGLFGQGQISPGGRTMPMPQPMPQPMRQPGFMPNTRAPGGGGMDYNGNPVGGGMGAQFNFAGPRPVNGPAYGGRPAPGDLYRPGVMPQPRMAAPMRPAAGPVRPASSITRTRRR